MKPQEIIRHIAIDEYSATPKYLQLTNSILSAIEAGKIVKDDILPSINELSFELDLSRDTIEKGYKHLKKMGVLGSVPGKGYYILSTSFNQRRRIFLLFNKLSAHKKIVYDAFVNALGNDAAIDFYIYNNNYLLFKKLLTERKTGYSHYVIIPHFIEDGENVHEVINSTIPTEKLVLLDKCLPGLKGNYASVCENFEYDIYNALEQAMEALSKYHTLKLVFPKNSYFPVEIKNGFNRFCHQYAFAPLVIGNLEEDVIAEGEAYICLMEDDLVTLVQKLVNTGLQVGKQVGVISYNETPLKKIILNGITTISTDFDLMGKLAAQAIIEHRHDHIEVPFYLTLRQSL